MDIQTPGQAGRLTGSMRLTDGRTDAAIVDLQV